MVKTVTTGNPSGAAFPRDIAYLVGDRRLHDGVAAFVDLAVA